MKQAHVVIQAQAWDLVAVAGTTLGWLQAWLRAAGALEVHCHQLEDTRWHDASGWMLVVADETELGRVALQHGRRLGVGQDGGRIVVGADALELDNPPRRAWHYLRGRRRWPTVLMPPGDLVHQRHAWMSALAGDAGLVPLPVKLDVHGRGDLEPGLATRGEGRQLNDCGYLPEEMAVQALHRAGLMLVTAESCTAGGIAARIARVPGASSVLWGGTISYANAAKQQWLAVPERVIREHGAVSQACVEAMASGAMRQGCAAIAVSGIAGPGGGTPEKPVGTVWLAVALPNRPILSRCHRFSGSRGAIQNAAAVHALALLLEALGTIPD